MSKYGPLERHLLGLAAGTWTASFADLQRILGSKLPPSASNHQAWWGNNDASVQAQAWLGAGWRVDSVNQLSGTVRFRRASSQARLALSTSEVQPTAAPVRSEVAASVSPEPVLAPYEWDEPDLVSCQVTFRWQPIGRVRMDEAGRPLFPVVPPSPGLYRFQIRGGHQHATYIGETDDLQRRFQHYRTPGVGQLTNIRVRDRLVEALRSGEEVGIAIVISGAQIASDHQSREADLASKAVRLLLENSALFVRESESIESLNR